MTTLLNSLKTKVFVGWSFFRFLRLGIGIYVTTETIGRGEWMFVPIGLLLIAQSLFNAGCAGGNCAIPADKSNANSEVNNKQKKQVE